MGLLQLMADASSSDAWWPGCPEFAVSETAAESNLKILLVVAHPDDESECAGTLYRLVHEFHATVDQAVVTGGEGGQHYCGPAVEYYGLSKKRTLAKELPSLRRKEVRRAGRIIGVRRHYFFGQKDNGFTLDPGDGFRNWNLPALRSELRGLLRRERYDLVLTLLPSEDTHGHHKTVALLALEAAESLPAQVRRPKIASASMDSTGFRRRAPRHPSRSGRSTAARPSLRTPRSTTASSSTGLLPSTNPRACFRWNTGATLTSISGSSKSGANAESACGAPFGLRSPIGPRSVRQHFERNAEKQRPAGQHPQPEPRSRKRRTPDRK
jgi:LmbE family N-acetylglucosaminyl deacetylase